MQNAHGWIDKETHPPSGADADEYGCVLVWHAFQGNMITGWRNALSNRFITHWQPTLPPPESTRREASQERK